MQNILQEIKKIDIFIKEKLNILPVIAAELEFYLYEDGINIQVLREILKKYDFIEDIINEVGFNQYEILFKPDNDPLNLAYNIDFIKQIIINDFKSTFQTKPFDNQPCSDLHIHINFLNQNGNNLFDKENGQDTDIFLHSIAGMLSTLSNFLCYFAPTEEDYKKYIPSPNTATTISWGINNRTTSLRITPPEKGPRRIEHRISSANSNPYEVIYAILYGAYYGIVNKLYPPERIWGNASDKQYNTKSLVDIYFDIIKK